jgi:membrane-associated phospholipid phosphatase
VGPRARRIRSFRSIFLLAFVMMWPAIGSANVLASDRLLSVYGDGSRTGGHWLGAAALRVAIPLPEPGFDSTLRWGISSAGLAPAPPSATLTGWLPNLLLAGAFAAVQFAADPPRDPRWRNRNSFDRKIRSGLRGNSRSGRRAAKHASDAFLYGMAGLMVGDWVWLRHEYGLARSLQVDSRWLLANNITTRVAKVSAGRERPYVRPCRTNSSYVSSCGSSRDRNAGFFSGHASNTATLAGLLCARHLGRRERSLVDGLVCGGAAAGSLTAGILRIVAERHYTTDVIAGWAVGAFFGYFLPSRFDYRGEPGDPFALSTVMPVVGREYYGLRYQLRF